MTINEAKEKLVNWCSVQLGYAEGANNYNKYAQNKVSAYGWNVQNQPWCDVFVDAGFIECFGLDMASKLTYQPKGAFSAKCSISADYYKNNNAWHYYPEVGDQAFFNVDGGINHTGIVTFVGNGMVSVTEGNSSDLVRRNTYSIGSSYINGYGRPKWSLFSKETSSSNPVVAEPVIETPKIKTCSVNIVLPVLEKGSKDTNESSWVKILQQRLLNCGESLPLWGADGDFGAETKKAVESFQKKKKIEVDGIVGVETWKALGV